VFSPNGATRDSVSNVRFLTFTFAICRLPFDIAKTAQPLRRCPWQFPRDQLQMPFRKMGPKMHKPEIDLGTRLIRFAASVIKLLAYIETSKSLRHISDQLLRSATSVGANYEEARAAESKADFIHKMQVSLKEMRESYYWLAVTIEAGITTTDQAHALHDEARQLRAILSKAVATAKANQRKC